MFSKESKKTENEGIDNKRKDNKHTKLKHALSQTIPTPQSEALNVPSHADKGGGGVQQMSTHDLINNPSTLQAGISLLSQCIISAMKPGRSTSSSTDVDGRRVLRRKRDPPAAESKANNDDSDSDPKIISIVTSSSSHDSNNGNSSNGKGASQFDELYRRFTLPETAASPSKKLEEFDLEAKGIFFRSVFSHYDEKEKMCEEHTQNIQKLTDEKVQEYFARVQPAILDVFEGRKDSIRTDLYLSRNKADLFTLKEAVVSAPFSNQAYMLLANMVLDFILPTRKSRERYLEYAQLVLIPEALIQIYSLVNGVDFEHAEKEMRYGPQYDGPLPKKRKVASGMEKFKLNKEDTPRRSRRARKCAPTSTATCPLEEDETAPTTAADDGDYDTTQYVDILDD